MSRKSLTVVSPPEEQKENYTSLERRHAATIDLESIKRPYNVWHIISGTKPRCRNERACTYFHHFYIPPVPTMIDITFQVRLFGVGECVFNFATFSVFKMLSEIDKSCCLSTPQ